MNEKLLRMVRAGLFASLICLLTALLHIPTPNGYIHCGDAVIYLAAVLLPMPYAVCAAAIGGAMADLFTGYLVYIPATFVIKALLAGCFGKIAGGETVSFRRKLLACMVCTAVSVVGYWLAAVILYGNAVAQLAETVPANVIQGIGSGILYFAVSAVINQKNDLKV